MRSGKYKQTIGQLKDGKAFCAAGLLCELYRKETKKGRWKGNYFFGNKTEHYVCFPPFEVDEWAGENGDSYLVTMNDTQRMTFEQIADVLDPREKNETK